MKVDADRNLLFVKGAVPGSKNGIVLVSKQGGRSRHA
jgi:ribosomal protein L3